MGYEVLVKQARLRPLLLSSTSQPRTLLEPHQCSASRPLCLFEVAAFRDATVTFSAGFGCVLFLVLFGTANESMACLIASDLPCQDGDSLTTSSSQARADNCKRSVRQDMLGAHHAHCMLQTIWAQGLPHLCRKLPVRPTGLVKKMMSSPAFSCLDSIHFLAGPQALNLVSLFGTGQCH